MVFDRQETGTRFPLGNAGVFSTLDKQNWNRLLSTTALPGHPIAGYFDSVSDPAGRALYVALPGRGILMLSLESLTNAPPTCSKAVASPSLLWPLNHNFVNVSVQRVTDPDGDPVTIRILELRRMNR